MVALCRSTCACWAAWLTACCLQEELAAAKETWLPQLKETVAKVSEAFSENFSRISSVGEVRLFEDGDNYEKYAVHIMVRLPSGGVRHAPAATLTQRPATSLHRFCCRVNGPQAVQCSQAAMGTDWQLLRCHACNQRC